MPPRNDDIIQDASKPASSSSRNSTTENRKSKTERSESIHVTPKSSVPEKPSSSSLAGKMASLRISQSPKSKEVKHSQKPKKISNERSNNDRSVRNSSSRSPKPRKSHKRVNQRVSKKGVYFNKTVGVNTIPNLDSYTMIETNAYWYTPDEYEQMEIECDQTAAILDAHPLAPLSMGLCARGLEAWTVEGEQRKEWNVQEAIDRVWQAQLEQWRSARDTSECWEFIRGEYLESSQKCCRDARTIGMRDEESVQDYMRSIRKIYKSRCSMFGSHQYMHYDTASNSLRRSTSDYVPKSPSKPSLVGRNHSEIVTSKSKSSSSGSSSPLLQRFSKSEEFKSSLKASSVYTSEPDESKETQRRSSKRNKSSKGKSKKISRVKDKKVSTVNDSQSVAVSYASTIESSLASSRKIVFRPRSKTKIPTSPVRSVCGDSSAMDESTTSRRMRSHMSVCSDDSTRRRMLRSAGIRPL